MFYICDQTPNHCPQCGKDLRPQWKNKFNLQDFTAHASFSCDCGAKYQLASTVHILDAADIEGDMKQHAER